MGHAQLCLKIRSGTKSANDDARPRLFRYANGEIGGGANLNAACVGIELLADHGTEELLALSECQ